VHNDTPDLITRALDPDAPALSSAERAQLNDTLRQDPAARDLLADVAYHARILHEALNTQTTTRDQDQTSPMMPVLSAVEGRRGRSVGYTFRDQGSGTRDQNKTSPMASPRAVGVALAAAAVITLALTAWFALPDFSNPQSEIRNPQSFASVATLTNTANAVFANTPAPMNLGGSLPAGPIHLTSGTAQVMFASTATVDLTGPCEFEMTGPNRGRLTSGTLEADVPENAKGFTIDLPDGSKIVDLGTRFQVQLDEADKACVVNVLEGRVRIEHHATALTRIVQAGHRIVMRPDDPGAVDAVAPYVLADWTFDELPIGQPIGSTRRIRDHGLYGRALSPSRGAPAPVAVHGAERFDRGTALRFDQATGPLVLGGGAMAGPTPDASLRFDHRSSFTVEAIINTRQQDPPGAIVANDWDVGKPSWWLRVDHGRPRFLIHDGSSRSVVEADQSVADGQWRHLAAVRDAEQRKLRLYIDHRLVAEVDDTTTGSPANQRDLRIGRYNNDQRAFVGAIGRVRLSSTALDPDRFIQPTRDTPQPSTGNGPTASDGAVTDILSHPIQKE